jgi:hypothetical protein
MNISDRGCEFLTTNIFSFAPTKNDQVSSRVVFDLLGKIVFRSENSLDHVHHLPPGWYEEISFGSNEKEVMHHQLFFIPK